MRTTSLIRDREVSASTPQVHSHGAGAASFGEVKTLEDFDLEPQPWTRQQVGALGSGGFLT